jgi:hypothetical protein
MIVISYERMQVLLFFIKKKADALKNLLVSFYTVFVVIQPCEYK